VIKDSLGTVAQRVKKVCPAYLELQVLRVTVAAMVPLDQLVEWDLMGIEDPRVALDGSDQPVLRVALSLMYVSLDPLGPKVIKVTVALMATLA